jgi:hypothetical protein
MARKPIRRGKRAAPGATSATPTTPRISFGGSSKLVAVVPDDGDYVLDVAGARVVVSKSSGAVTVVLTVKDVDSGNFVKVRPLLVGSAGGDSDLVHANRAFIELLLGLGPDDHMELDDVVAKLDAGGIQFEAELQAGTDGRGQEVADIVEVLSVNGVAVEE